MKNYRILILLLVGLWISIQSQGQSLPSKPASYPVFAPQLINPGITGSKDFSNLNLTLKVNGSPGAQLATYTTRLAKKNSQTFSNIGLGGYLFHDKLGISRNLVAGLSAAWHIPLGPAKVSGLAIGVSAKGVFNMITEEGEITGGASNSFRPNSDLGIWYYGPRGFLGASAINFIPVENDTLPAICNETCINREQFVFAGYRILLSRKHSIVLEPSLLVNISDSLLTNPFSNLRPYLKIYIQNACIGSYYRDPDHLSLFLQYQFERIYTGVFVEFPRKQMLNSYLLTIDLTLGIRLGNDNPSPVKINPW